MTTTQEIITAFELFIGDETELSSQEELNLVQKIYNKVLASEEWEFLKKEAAGTVSGTTINQPSDFDRLTTDQNIYLGTNQQQINIVPFTERRLYRNANGYAYYDAKNEQLVFTFTQNNTYSYDYIYVPPQLDTVSSNPVFPARFYDMLYHGMCVDSDIINLSDKARSYAKENQFNYESILNDMKTWNKKISGFQVYGV
jgi:hypothetical protein